MNAPHNTITSIDHPVIAVRDMEASRATYEKLGFTVPPRGSHVEWGTGNWCIMFPRDYLELRGIIDPARFTLDLDKHLAAHGEGMMGLAFGTTGADAAHAEMTSRGMRPKPVRALSRNFELPEGWVQPKFRLCFPDAADVEGLQHVVLCEHLTPGLIRKPEFLAHANGVTGVAGLVGVVEDLDRVEAAQRKLLGDGAVRRAADGLHLQVPSGQAIELLAPTAFTARYGRWWPDLARARAHLPVLRLAAADLRATARCLETHGVPFDRVDGSLVVAPAHACGVICAFESSQLP